MKKALLALALTVLGVTAQAQSTYQEIGQFTYGSNGYTGQTIGNFRHHSINGNPIGTTQRIGQFDYHTGPGLNGPSQRIGNFTHHNINGQNLTTQSIGNFDYTTNQTTGKMTTCQWIGSQYVCN